MTGKDRMLVALERGEPDRLPVTIHQWQEYHLREYMGGRDQLEAYRATGLDASVTPWDVQVPVESPDWDYRVDEVESRRGGARRLHTARTPRGELRWTTVTDKYTTFMAEHVLKSREDAEIFLEFWPGTRLDRRRLEWWYDRTGDDGIVRGFVVHFAQAGPWQEFCELAGTENAIFWAADDPDFVHYFLDGLTRRRVEWVYREFPGAKYDLIEQGGGAASSTVISPKMFEEFCVPYDRRINDALRESGFSTVYHTCGGMMAILDRIANNGTDASETLSPPGVGGDIGTREDRLRVKEILGRQVALIGGVDQNRVLTNGTPSEIREAVIDCFETYGRHGGYICSASDHFFHAPVGNLEALAQAAKECTYR